MDGSQGVDWYEQSPSPLFPDERPPRVDVIVSDAGAIFEISADASGRVTRYIGPIRFRPAPSVYADYTNEWTPNGMRPR